MKSIKEKAEEYGYTNWQSDEYHDGASEGLEFDPIGHTQKTFEAGANYVLDAITECMPKTHSFNSNEAIDIIVSRIKQLKSNQ